MAGNGMANLFFLDEMEWPNLIKCFWETSFSYLAIGMKAPETSAMSQPVEEAASVQQLKNQTKVSLPALLMGICLTGS